MKSRIYFLRHELFIALCPDRAENYQDLDTEIIKMKTDTFQWAKLILPVWSFLTPGLDAIRSIVTMGTVVKESHADNTDAEV